METPETAAAAVAAAVIVAVVAVAVLPVAVVAESRIWSRPQERFAEAARPEW